MGRKIEIEWSKYLGPRAPKQKSGVKLIQKNVRACFFNNFLTFLLKTCQASFCCQLSKQVKKMV